jgi:oxygen-independent coproporphyrinogen-3 oxidase
MPDLGLYLHVPFCRSKCAWCAFVSVPGRRRIGSWLERIIGQLAEPPLPHARWVTAYIGGGTPSLLSPAQLDRLMAAISPNLAPGAEVTLEANPESLSAEHLAVFGGRGGTRLSLGIQTFDEGILIRHGRPTRRRHLDAAFRLTRTWKGTLSLDLICGLAGQTEAGQARDLEQALSWNPDHLSFYSLTLEAGTPLAQRVARGSVLLPGEDEASRWWLNGRDRLEKAGLSPYEVSNFSKPGAQSRHNGRYWALEPWWGLGPSAASFLPRLRGGFEYRTEADSFDSWLEGKVAEVEVPSPLELAKDRLMVGLRRTAGVGSLPWADRLPRTREAWKGRLLEAEGRLFLTPKDLPFLDAFLREAFAELDGSPEFR